MIFNHCAVSSNLAKCRKAIFYITKVPSRSVAQDYTTKINNAEARFPVPVEHKSCIVSVNQLLFSFLRNFRKKKKKNQCFCIFNC